MPQDYQLTPWPRRIRIEQSGPERLHGPHASIYDAHTGEKLEWVVRIEIEMERLASIITVWQSKYTPMKSALGAAEDEDLFEGMIIAKHEYLVTRLACEAGV